MRFLFGRRGNKPTFDAPINPGEPFFAIGDIHGCDFKLAALLERIQESGLPGRKVFVGDYADRGEDSAMVHRRLHSLSKEDDSAVFLRGNHEEMLLMFLDDPAEHGAWWMRHGGLQTCSSYRVAPPTGSDATEEDWYAARDALVEQMGEIPDWLRNLPLIWQTGNVAVVHAAADPELPMQLQPEETLLWGHPEFGTTLRTDGIWVVHGHVIQETLEVENGCIPTDSGAYATGRLSAAWVGDGSVQYITA
ncbi:metallophosphoesterase [Chachezhania sediminis]|uniref:metallophosphoesterase n=1 Tax=Chachezhania sediminis TaxID=2599291 RepID=UPI00131A9725|nr:metallophosphoesterase [Chachezhania sediminis]